MKMIKKASDFKAFREKLKAKKNPPVAVLSSKAAFEKTAEAGTMLEIKNIV